MTVGAEREERREDRDESIKRRLKEYQRKRIDHTTSWNENIDDQLMMIAFQFIRAMANDPLLIWYIRGKIVVQNGDDWFSKPVLYVELDLLAACLAWLMARGARSCESNM